MTVTQRDLEQEISEIVEGKIDAGEVVIKPWLVHHVVGAHVGIAGEDEGWYRLCAFKHVTATVGEIVRRYKPKPETDPQVCLPGFTHLQRAYAVERDGSPCVVPIHQLTDAEIEAKIAEMDRMRSGLTEHIDELRRYRGGRVQAA